MPTETDPRLPVARSVDSPTVRTPAVRGEPSPADPPSDGPEQRLYEWSDLGGVAPRTPAVYPGDPNTAAAAPSTGASPALTDDPDPEVEPYPDGWATSALTAHAQRLHAGCGCDWGGDVEGHGGVDFESEAARDRAQIIGEALDSGEVIHPDTVKAPVETKVAVGGYTGILAALVLAVSTAGLQQTDTFRGLLGDNPWSGPAVLAVGVVLTAAQTWAAYQAPHTPRPDVGAVQR